MPATPWNSLQRPQPDRGYLVVLTHLPLRRPTTLPRFLLHLRAIQHQLDNTDGLIGYSLLAKPLHGHYWTLSAWENDAALQQFTQAHPHHAAMAKTAPCLNGFTHTRWTLRGEREPLGLEVER